MKRKYFKKIQNNIGLFWALISACLYAFNVIIEKRYITVMSSEKILFLMYLGAGTGLELIPIFEKFDTSLMVNDTYLFKEITT